MPFLKKRKEKQNKRNNYNVTLAIFQGNVIYAF